MKKLAMLVAALMAVAFVGLNYESIAYANDRAIPSIGVSGGTDSISVVWSAPAEAPYDYRLAWGPEGRYISYKASNTTTAGNAYPGGSATSYTISGLDPGTYSVKLRARYEGSAGPWKAASSVVVTGDTPPPVVVVVPEPTAEPEPPTSEQQQDEPPTAPTGLTASQVAHDSVTLTWSDPENTSITGYRILRGTETGKLSVVAQDTGSADTEYTDSTVAAETTYHYAVLALSADGDGAQSAALSVTTPAAPKKREDNRVSPRQTAQTIITLVSNTGQADGDSGNLGAFDQAQAFTTGGHAAGYKLTGVDIEFNTIVVANTASYPVSIRNVASNGHPGTSVGTLASPASLAANAMNSYTSSGIDLTASTTYFVHVDSSSASTNNLQNTASDNEDSGAQSGFSIANDSRFSDRALTSPSWTSHPQSKKIAIKGYAKTAVTDTTAPAFASAAADGTSLVITFTEDLAAAASLTNSAFTVKKTAASTETTVTLSTTVAPVISGKTVTLTLGTALVSTDTAVKVSYTKPTSGTANKLVDAAANETGTFTDQPVTNNTPAAQVVSIVAVHPKASPFLAAVEFRVTRAPVMTTPLTVTLSIAQTAAYLFNTAPTITIPANQTSAVGKYNSSYIGTTAGTVTATVVAGTGYAPATAPANAATVTFAAHPSPLTMGWASDTYTVTEGDTLSAGVTLRTRDGAPKPRNNYSIGLETQAGTALPTTVMVPNDYVHKSVRAVVEPAAWSADGMAFVATALVTVATVEDRVDEGDEQFSLRTSRWSGNAGYETTCTAAHQISTTDCRTFVTIADDDTRGVTVSATTLDVNEGSTGTYTVKLDSQPTASVTVTPSKTGSGDVTFSPASLTFSTLNWPTAQTVTVTAAQDTDAVDDNATISHTISGGDYGSATAASVVVTVDDDETAGTTAFISNTGQTESRTAGASADTFFDAQQFTTGSYADGYSLSAIVVKISAASLATPAFALYQSKTENGVDVPGTKVVDLSGSVATAGQQSFTPASATTLSASTKYFVVVASSSGSLITSRTHSGDEDSGGSPGWSIADNSLYTTDSGRTWASSRALLKIAVKGTRAPTDSTAPAFASAAANGASLVITFDENLAAAASLANSAFTVKKTPSGGSEATVTLSTTVAPVISGRTVTLTLATALVSTDTAVKVSYTKPTTGSNNKLVDAAANATATFTDQTVTNNTPAAATTPVITIAAGTSPVTEGTAAAFTLTRTGSATAALTVNVSVSESGDMVAAANEGAKTATFTANSATAALSVATVGDSVDEANSVVTVTVDTATPAIYTVGTPASATVTVQDNDTRGVTVSAATLTVNEGSTGTYTVKLDSQPTASVTVTPSKTGSGDVTFSPTSLTFLTSNWSATQTVTVTAADDSDAADDSATISHAVTGGDYGSVTAASVVVTVDDDETTTLALPVITIAAGTSPVTEGTAAAFTLTRTGSTTAELSVNVTVSESGDMVASANEGAKTATFTANSATATLSVATVGDRVDQANSVVTMTVTAIRATYTVGTPASATVTVQDDDTRGVTVSAATLTVNEGSTGTYTVKLDSQPTASVTVTPSKTGSSDVTFAPASLTFLTSNWSATQTVTVTAADDSDAADDTATISHAVAGGDYGSVTAASVVVTVRDDETGGNNLPTSRSGTVTATEDTAFTLSESNFAFSDGDSGDTLASVKITELPAAGKGTLALDGTAITSSALPKTVTKAELDASKLKYTPPANGYGTAYTSFKFKVNDGTADSAAAYTMTINVTNVNDPATGRPTFSGGTTVGSVLTASIGGISDPDGVPSSISYQWKRFAANGTTFEANIGTNSNRYTLTEGDAGKRLKVEVSFTDNGGTREGPLLSAATATVQRPSSGSLSVGGLGAYWHDNHDNGGNLLRVDSCSGVKRFRVIWAGPEGNRRADEWDAEITDRGGARTLSPSFRETPGSPGNFEMTGTVNFTGPGIVTFRVQGRFGSTWGTWSPKASLHCFEN